MDELTKLELNKRFARLSNADLLGVIERKVLDRGFISKDLEKPLSEEIEFARSLYVMRMGL